MFRLMLSKRSSKFKHAISRGATIAIVVIVVIVIVGGAYAALTLAPASSTTTTSTSSSTGTSSTSSSSSTSICNIGQCTTTTTSTSTSGSITPPPGTNTSQLVDESPNGPYDSLDPAYGFFTVDGFFGNVFQGLVAYNGSSSLEVVPSLASSWNVSSNAENYTFTMRPNTWFSTKDPVNAYVAWFSFVRELYWNAPTTVGISNYLNLAVNASTDLTHDGNVWPHGLQAALIANGVPNNENSLTAALNQMLSNFNPTNTTQQAIMSYSHQAFVAVSSSTFQINLIQPYKPFLLALPAQWGAIQDPVYIDAHGGVMNNTGPAKNSVVAGFNANGMPGTGPYEYGPNPAANPQVLVLNANPNYWASNITSGPLQAPHIKTIVMKFGLLPNTVISDFGAGVSQLTGASMPINQFGQAWSTWQSGIGKSYSSVGFTGVVSNLGAPLCDLAAGMNTQFGPLNNTLLRQAIVHSINYSAIQQQLYTFNGQAFASLFIPPVPPGWGPLDNPDNIPLYSYNITLANQLANEAGIQGHFSLVNGSGVTIGDTSAPQLAAINFDYIVPLTPQLTTEIGIIQQGLANIGVRITPTGITTAEYDIAISVPNNGVPIVNVGWCADWADPIYQQFYDMATTVAHQPNWVNNATLNALLAKIPFETNSTQQLADTKLAYQIFTQLSTIIQIPNADIYFWMQPYVTGLTYSPFQFAVLYNYLSYK
jgi:peptide/nickel transport system substrate-binding protein